MNIKSIARLSLVLPLLTSCGAVVGSLIPPQTISNPANLNGATLSSSSPLTVQKVVGSIQYDTSATIPAGSFDDMKYPSEVPFGIRPHAASIKVSLKTATLSGACEMPDSFTLTLETFAVSVWDSSNKNGAVTLSGSPMRSVVATRSSSGLGSSTYALAANSVTVSSTKSTTDAAITILTSGGQNDASASAKISADKDSMAGCRLSFELGDSSVTLSDFN